MLLAFLNHQVSYTYREEGNYLSSKIFFWTENIGSLFTHDCSHSRKNVLYNNHINGLIHYFKKNQAPESMWLIHSLGAQEPG